MSPSGWSARGDSNPDLHGLGVPRLPIAPRADDVIGPSGWTRTTTSRVKSPACCVHTPKGNCSWSEWRDSNPRLKAWKARGQPLPHIRVGSAYGYRTRPSALATRNASSTPRPNVDRYRSPAHRLSSVIKDPALASWWAARDSNPIAPLGKNGFTARQRTIRSYRPLATAPGFEPGPTRFGGSDAAVTPRCRCCFRSPPFQRQNLPVT
jgi:hypothetical protein